MSVVGDGVGEARPHSPVVEGTAGTDAAVGKNAEMRRFALAVMGSGSGNVLIPEHPDGPVAIIEHGTFGGTCINRGCIPSKMLLRAADVASGAAHAGTFGVGVTVTGVDWPAIRDRVFATTDGVSCDGRDHRRRQDGVTLFEGSARFVGPRTLAVGDETLQADQVVIATGSSPVVPPVFAGAGVEVHTSDTVMRLAALPASMIIVGGGYVAVEQAHLFSSLGVEVTVIEAADRLLPGMDTGVADRFTDLAGKRWTLALGTAVAEVGPDDGGVAVTTEDGRSFAAGTLLVATGRRANTGDLDVDAAGIGLTNDGRIEVDRYGRAAEGVWALGDCASPHPLKHVANAEARTIAHNLGHPDDLRPLPHEAVPSAVFSEPQVASVGARRQDLEGVDHVVASTPFGDVAYGWALRDDSGFCTIYADPRTGRLLGAHIIGPDAALLLTPLVQALAHGQRAADLARGQYWIHPALSEVVEQTLLALDVDQTVRSGQVH